MAPAALTRCGLRAIVNSRGHEALRNSSRRACGYCARAVFGKTESRLFSTSSLHKAKDGENAQPTVEKSKLWDSYKQSSSSQESFSVSGVVTVHGFLGKRRDISAKAAFIDVVHPGQTRPVQIRSAWDVEGSPEYVRHQQLKAANAYSPVAVTGEVESVGDEGNKKHPLLRLHSIQVLNEFPRDIIVSKGVQFPATARHLQMRFSEVLQRRLAFRSDVAAWSRRRLTAAGLCEFETPVLFKSTPEGAREFIVPTRRRGFAYALPQSPQQFKQILMASGVAGGYFQFARCFRDEDLRADRQPEFTQLDLEMAFATGEDVMQAVERYTKDLFAYLGESYRVTVGDSGDTSSNAVPVPVETLGNEKVRPFAVLPSEPFRRMTYDEAMTRFGSDKPDLRIPGEIHRIDDVIPIGLKRMISSLDDPIVDAWRLRLDDGDPYKSRDFVKQLFDNLPPALAKNPEGMTAVLIYNLSKPLCGLDPLGHEAFGEITDPTTETNKRLAELPDFQDGDILLLQARKRELFFSGGSTAMGQIRVEAYRKAVELGLLARDDSFRFLWVVGFPMFTPTEAKADDPGQGGHAGFSATHHPFTAPLTEQDFELMQADPLRAKADHYDLVVNGVELGGGSRRIHVAAVQEAVMRDILKMDDAGVAQFEHLLEALRAGCPPHAGFALGFDRLIAVLSGTTSVRDVIAFPKSMKGEDLSVKSPGRLSPAQLETYHLALRSAKTDG